MTMAQTQQIAGHTVLVVTGEAEPLTTVEQFTALIGDCLGEGADVLALPADTIGEGFSGCAAGSPARCCKSW